MTVVPYEDSNKFKIESSIKDKRLRTKIIVALAESGNVEAAYNYGLMLLKGVWDEKATRKDLAHGKLEPSPKLIQNDPYLILSRDPLKAVEYFKMAAEFPDHDDQIWNTKSKAILLHMQKHGLAGFLVNDNKINFGDSKAFHLTNIEEAKLKYYAKNFAKSTSNRPILTDMESNAFVPLPDVRPIVEDLKNGMFRNIALRSYGRVTFQYILIINISAIISFSLYLSGSQFGNYYLGLLLVSLSLIFLFPLCLFLFLVEYYGLGRKVPICSCSKIHEAHEEGIKEIDDYSSVYDDPFEETPYFIKNLLFIKHSFYWFCGITGLLIGALSTGFQSFLGFITFLYSFYAVFYDKSFKSKFKKLKVNSKVYFFILFFLFFLFEDVDCEEEAKRFKLLNDESEEEAK